MRGIIIINFVKKIFNFSNQIPDKHSEPTLYPRAEHCISRSQISENALKVLYRLNKAGFDAYLVGGCVRDLLLGREPKDFDVATNASPEEVKATFRNCRLIGRRFRLAHVHFGREIIEVATFRGSEEKESDDQQTDTEGRLLRDNVFGTLEEDVWRRDFTVNALYYNIKDYSVVDYAGGMQDHQAGLIRLIGDPLTRYREDPVRMLRAVRFAVKLGFTLHEDTAKPIGVNASLLASIPPARLFDETLKLFLSGYGVQTFEMLRHYDLFAMLFPDTDQALADEEHEFPRMFLIRALQNSDNRLAEDKSVTPYFLFAALLWEPFTQEVVRLKEEGQNDSVAYQNAANTVLSRQVKVTSIPKRITQSLREVWLLQSRFESRKGARPYRLLAHPRFRAAYDFLLLRADAGGADPSLAEWWTSFQNASEAEQKQMTSSGNARRGKRRTKRHSAPRSASNP